MTVYRGAGTMSRPRPSTASLTRDHNGRKPLGKINMNRPSTASSTRQPREKKKNAYKRLGALYGMNSTSSFPKTRGGIIKRPTTAPNKRKIGFVFQDYPLFPHLNIIENISINLEKKFLTKIDYILTLTNLQDLSHRYPHQLSGGQARRVCVARALAQNPKMIIADEPTAGLDVSIQGEILNLLSELQDSLQLPILIVTHNLNVVRHISDRMVIMLRGKIVEQGATEEIFSNPSHDYTKRLLTSNNHALHGS